MAKVISAHSLQRSWTYRNRSRVTGLVVLTAWAYVALTRPWIPQGSALDWIVDAAAWLAFLGGATLRLWATLWIAGRKKNKLVDDGPYRACRNPLYLGTFAMGIGPGSVSEKPRSLRARWERCCCFMSGMSCPPKSGTCRSSARTTTRATVPRVPRWIPQSQPAPPRRDFPPTRRPDGAPPRMLENGRLAAAGGAGPVDVPPPRNGLVGLVSREPTELGQSLVRILDRALRRAVPTSRRLHAGGLQRCVERSSKTAGVKPAARFRSL